LEKAKRRLPDRWVKDDAGRGIEGEFVAPDRTAKSVMREVRSNFGSKARFRGFGLGVLSLIIGLGLSSRLGPRARGRTPELAL
jgi:hypothetical protein